METIANENNDALAAAAWLALLGAAVAMLLLLLAFLAVSAAGGISFDADGCSANNCQTAVWPLPLLIALLLATPFARSFAAMRNAGAAALIGALLVLAPINAVLWLQLAGLKRLFFNCC